MGAADADPRELGLAARGLERATPVKAHSLFCLRLDRARLFDRETDRISGTTEQKHSLSSPSSGEHAIASSVYST